MAIRQTLKAYVRDYLKEYGKPGMSRSARGKLLGTAMANYKRDHPRSGMKVKKIKRSSPRRGQGSSPKKGSAGAGPRTKRTVTHMARRKGKKGGRRKHGIPSIATIIVGANALNELGILKLLADSVGPDKNIMDNAQAWAETVKPGDMVDAFLPAVVLMFVRKFIGRGPRFGPITAW